MSTATMSNMTDATLSTILRVNFNKINEYMLKTHSSSLTQRIYNNGSLTMDHNNNHHYHHHHRVEYLQEIVSLFYKMKFIELVQSLWLVYRRSGLDDLQINLEAQNIINRQIWPKEIQFVFNEVQLSLFGKDIEIETLGKERQCQIYLNFIDEFLRTTNKKRDEFHSTLKNRIRHHLPEYDSTVENRITQFIEREFLCLQTEINCHIELVQFDYQDQIYQQQYLAELKADEQINSIERLCQLRYEQELLKTDIKLMKEQIPVYFGKHKYETEAILTSPLIECLRMPNIQRDLYQLHHQTHKQSRNNRLADYIRILEQQKNDFKNEFNRVADEMFERNKEAPFYQLLTSSVQDAMDQRLWNIVARQNCIYGCKTRLLELQSIGN